MDIYTQYLLNFRYCWSDIGYPGPYVDDNTADLTKASVNTQ